MILVGEALARIDLDKETVEYQHTNGAWYQIRDNGDGTGQPERFEWAGVKWRPARGNRRLLMSEYAAPCRVLSARKERGSPYNRGPINGGAS